MGLKKYVKRVTSLFKKPKTRNQDARAEAATQLVREDVKRQAGAGQVAFTEEKRV